MGGVFDSLNVGYTGLSAHALALQVVGHNVANANNPGYSRQRVQFEGYLPYWTEAGWVGTGVKVERVEQIRSLILDEIYREDIGMLAEYDTMLLTINQIESMFYSTDDSLREEVDKFFDSVSDLVNGPEDVANRVIVTEQAIALSNQFNDKYNRLFSIRNDLNQQVAMKVDEINGITSQIAEVSRQIQRSELSGDMANDLRDQRNTLIDRLSEITSVEVFEMTDGTVSIVMGGDSIVSGTAYRELEVYTAGSPIYEIRFADNGVDAVFHNGEMKGILESRDTHIVNAMNKLNDLATGIIESVNRVHSSGRGLNGYTSLTSVNAVNNPANALNAAGLPFTPVSGSFDIIVIDQATGTETTHTVNIDLDGAAPPDTTLNDIVSAIGGTFGSGFGNIRASVSSNQLVVEADSGYSFVFANDSSDTLLALGVNTLFTGSDASNMGVNSVISSNPELLAAAQSSAPGDNTNAIAMYQLKETPILNGGTATFDQFYQTWIGELGVEADEVRQNSEFYTLMSTQSESNRQNYMGVSLDEEATNMMKYQHAYSAAAKYISVVNSMMGALVQMV